MCTFAVLAFGSDSAKHAAPLWVRLTSPVSSYAAKVNDPVHAILIEEVRADGQLVFPVGTHMDGVVRSVHKVGFGIRHETATLQLVFTTATPPGGVPVTLQAIVTEVENAREEVKRGVIDGVTSSNTPQGRITSRYKYLPTWNPYTDFGLIAFKLAFPVFPEPEIYLPAGTDLRLKLESSLNSVARVAELNPTARFDAGEEWELEQLAKSFPQRSTTLNLADADLVNLVFLGSREQVDSAFRHAGWNTTDASSKRAVMNSFYAFLNDSDYGRAPMRTLLLNGSAPDMNWQKSLNTYAKRDHLRIWEWPASSNGQPLWLSASTHDTGATLSLKYHRFVHHISPDIDEERSKVIRDLSLAGCVRSQQLIPRRSVSPLFQNATGDLVRTDGALAVVQLQDCAPEIPAAADPADSAKFKAGNKWFRYARREILTVRSDLWRANIVYGVYELGSLAVSAMRHHAAMPVPAENAAAGPPGTRSSAFSQPNEPSVMQ